MDFEESDKLFEQGSALVEQGKYQEALVVWKQLYKAFPRDRDILFNSAVCLENVGRYDEGLALCNDLIEVYQDPRGYEMKARMEAAKNVGGLGGAMAGGIPNIGGVDMPVLDLNNLDIGGLNIPGMNLGGGDAAGGGMPAIGPGMLDDLGIPPLRKTQPPKPAPAAFNWKPVIILGCALGVLVLLGLAMALIRG